MLKSIFCDKFTSPVITFGNGLNAIVGAEDGYNSIGKSTALLLVDFAFGGSDLVTKCDDVIRNIGHIDITITFEFDKVYLFRRSTENPNEVLDLNQDKLIPLFDFSSFLKDKYSITSQYYTFRDCVSGFSRIYRRENYNENRPLDAFPKDNWKNIRKRMLNLFDEYWKIAQLEGNRASEEVRLKDINGAFNSGAVTKITKRQYNSNVAALKRLRLDIDRFKESLEGGFADARAIVDENIASIKHDKDVLLKKKIALESSLNRIKDNLSGVKSKSRQSLDSILTFFPEIEESKIYELDAFHKGITGILKKQLQNEIASISKKITILRGDIDELNDHILSHVGNKEDVLVVFEHYLDLDRLYKELSNQNFFKDQLDLVKSKIKEIKQNINAVIDDALCNIENVINQDMRKYICEMYGKDSISPILNFEENKYTFEQGDDRGTGKAYANMIALDLAIMNNTQLPYLIHDSLLFKNMSVSAIDSLILIYSRFDKQIFISIDEVTKYSQDVQMIIGLAKVVQLDKDNVAFIKKWKEMSQ